MRHLGHDFAVEFETADEGFIVDSSGGETEETLRVGFDGDIFGVGQCDCEIDLIGSLSPKNLRMATDIHKTKMEFKVEETESM